MKSNKNKITMKNCCSSLTLFKNYSRDFPQGQVMPNGMTRVSHTHEDLPPSSPSSTPLFYLIYIALTVYVPYGSYQQYQGSKWCILLLITPPPPHYQSQWCQNWGIKILPPLPLMLIIVCRESQCQHLTGNRRFWTTMYYEWLNWIELRTWRNHLEMFIWV